MTDNNPNSYRPYATPGQENDPYARGCLVADFKSACAPAANLQTLDQNEVSPYLLPSLNGEQDEKRENHNMFRASAVKAIAGVETLYQTLKQDAMNVTDPAKSDSMVQHLDAIIDQFHADAKTGPHIEALELEHAKEDVIPAMKDALESFIDYSKINNIYDHDPQGAQGRFNPDPARSTITQFEDLTDSIMQDYDAKGMSQQAQITAPSRAPGLG